MLSSITTSFRSWMQLRRAAQQAVVHHRPFMEPLEGRDLLSASLMQHSHVAAIHAPLGIISIPGDPIPTGGFVNQGLNSVPLAIFTDESSPVVAGHSATIDWGDGTPITAGQISLVSSGGNGVDRLLVSGTHTFANTGSFDVTIHISADAGARTGVVKTTATIVTGFTAVGQPVTTQPGVPVSNGLVALFVDVANSPPNTYTATINWGDGSPTSPGAVIDGVAGDNVYEVHGSHTFANVGSYPMTITINGPGSRQAVAQSLAIVGQDNLLASGADLQAIAGNAIEDVVVSGFIDPKFNTQDTDYTATIDWGDQTTPSAGVVVSLANHAFNVLGSHTYANPGTYLTRVNIHHSDGRQTFAVGTFRVTDEIAGIGFALNTLEDKALNNVRVGTFADAKGGLNPADYTVLIDWGDASSPTPGAVSSSGVGGFLVRGSHTYSTAGSYPITLTITTADERSGQFQATAVVEVDSLIRLNALNGIRVEKIESRLVPVAVFRDVAPQANAMLRKTRATAADAAESAYTALIDWGDDNQTEGVIRQRANGQFVVLGKHRYASPGVYDVSVDVTHIASQRSSDDQSQIRVARLPRFPIAQAVNPLVNVPFDDVVLRFFDADPTLRASNFNVTIRWGDGSVSNGRVEDDGQGRYRILGSHTYTQRAEVGMRIDIKDIRGDVFSGVFRVRVS